MKGSNKKIKTHIAYESRETKSVLADCGKFFSMVDMNLKKHDASRECFLSPYQNETIITR